jgi:putative Mn2+ efflux pump MntP
MRRHAFDPVAFTFGALFLAIAVAGMTGPWSLRDLDLAWLGPAVLVFLGLVVLLTALTPRRAASAELDEAADDTADDLDEGETVPR